MRQILYILTAIVLGTWATNINAQCPTLYDLKVDEQSETTVCAPGKVELSVSGIQMPSKGTIQWYYSEDENFDPRTGGDLVGNTQLPELTQQSCPTVCPDLLMIMMNSCDGSGSEPDNEFFIFTSGSGFYASDMQFKINSGTNDNTANDKSINIGSGACQIQKPSNAFMTRLQKDACSNLNLFAAGPGDFIPADALVIFYMSSNVTIDYDLTTLCESGYNVYVMQNSCKRTMGAFTNSSTTTDSYRENFLSIKNCTKCIDSLNYNRKGMLDLEGEYIIDNDFQYASVENGSVLLNTQGNPCQTPDLSNYLKPVEPYKIQFDIAPNSPLCGKKLFFKAYVTPSDESICLDVVASGASLNVICGGSEIEVLEYTESVCSGSALNIELESQGDYTWTVDAPAGISGLSNGSGIGMSNITQTPIYTGTSEQIVTYTISLTDTDCPVDPVKIEIRIGPELTAEITGETQVCSGSSTTLSVIIPDVTTIATWSNGKTGASIEVTQSGTYSVELTNSVCTVSDTVEVNISDELQVEITGKTAICSGESTTLTAQSGFDSYVWSTGTKGISITVDQAGTYTLTVTKGDCSGSATVEVTQAEDVEILADIISESCKGNDGIASLSIDGVEFTVLWSTGETTKTIKDKVAGTYSYTVQYGACIIEGSVEITKSEDKITADVQVLPLGCDNEKGSISISNIANGTPPYLIAINEDYIEGTSIENLELGTYAIYISDSKGCILEQAVEVTEAPQVNVVLPENISITQGQEVVINSTVTGIDVESDKTIYTWTPSSGLSCTDCPTPTASPSETTDYILVVENDFGCKDADTIQVMVLAQQTVYLPNAFSPNSDGKNDILYILSNSNDVKIKKFEIFNRWGESVFKVENVLVNDPSNGWNGYYKNKLAAVDNYSYYYEVEFSDGSIARDKGALLIVR
ncbi:MAG TPA: gliding motility-associated C-terminal domain-containing protein [Chitinophagales bacterium]|nr:gliding motility-associated C-terminal domain-containing protein [Chitinophagales bacterium]